MEFLLCVMILIQSINLYFQVQDKYHIHVYKKRRVSQRVNTRESIARNRAYRNRASQNSASHRNARVHPNRVSFARTPFDTTRATGNNANEPVYSDDLRHLFE